MKTLNRPMFRYGGPIKEGIMNGMKEKQAINTVGSPLAPKDETGRGGYALPLIPAIMAGVRALPTVYRGIRTASKFSPSQSGGFFRNLLPTGRFTNVTPTIARTKARTVPNASGSYSGVNITANKPLSILQSLRDPTRLGQAIRENPFTAGTIGIGAAGQIKNIPDIVSGGVGMAADTGLGIANYLLGTDFARGKKEKVPEGDGTGLKRGTKEEGKTKVVTTPNVSGTGEGAKQEINEDRIQATKDRYYKLMGIDKMNKDATYDSLIDASKIIQQEGGDLKGSIKSGSLQSQLISAISKNLDKSSALKKQIDAAVLKGEIEKDIKANDPSSAVDLAYKKAATQKLQKDLKGSSAADVLATAEISGKNLVTSNTLRSILQSKGTDVSFTFPDDKYQKWEKNNENKDEIDYLQENYGGLDDGLYVVNKKAVQVRDGSATFVDLDEITG